MRIISVAFTWEISQTRDQKSFLACLFYFLIGLYFMGIYFTHLSCDDTLLALLGELKMKNGFTYFYR